MYSQGKHSNHMTKKKPATRLFDSSVIAILSYDISAPYEFRDLKKAELTKRDFNDIEIQLSKCVSEYNHTHKFSNINLRNYKRQYIAVTNAKGEKEVWVNCFCEIENDNWKKEIEVVFDGGDCYFDLKINLSTKKYYDLMVNGVA